MLEGPTLEDALCEGDELWRLVPLDDESRSSSWEFLSWNEGRGSEDGTHDMDCADSPQR